MTPDEELVGTRFQKKPERLTRAYFDPDHLFRGLCMYCESPVFIWRDNNLKLQPNHCNCVLCGQRYYVAYEDLETLFGYPPHMEGIGPFEYQQKIEKWLSIDA